jgi:HEAT repeat protein
MHPSRILAALVVVTAVAGVSGPAVAQYDSGRKEADLIAVLASNAAEADKALVCKQLAVHGSAAAVPELAKLLGNERLSSWARIALEAIPDPACAAALRQAAATQSGRLAVGMINSLATLRDPASVEVLTRRLGDGDPQVASAAAVALGSIGDAPAAAVLRAALGTAPGGTDAAVRSAIAEGLVLCGERALASGNAADAVTLYDLVRQADLPPQRIREATRGAILARGAAGVQLLVDQLRSEDRGLFNIGLSTARELRAAEVDAAIIAELAKAPPARAALLVAVLADRGSPQALPAIAQAAASGSRELRLAAVRGLGKLGDAAGLQALLAAAGDPDADLAAAAKAAIGELSGGTIDAEIRARLPQARGAALVPLLELVGRRRIDAVPEVVAAMASSDKAVRAAAVTALGEIADLDRLAVLVEQVVKPQDEQDRAVATKALRTAAVRMPDRDACAERLAVAIAAAPPETKVVLLDVLGEVGGPRALAAIATAAGSGDAALQDAGTRLLGGWMTADAGPVLLDLAKKLPEGKFQSRSFRGYLRIARQFAPSDAEGAAMCRQALANARDLEDKRFVLEALKTIPARESIELAVEAGATPELREAARAAAAAVLAQAGDKIPGGWELAAKLGLARARIEIVKATYGAGTNQRDVTEVLRKRAGSGQLIVLADPSFNKSFGGDPAPGQRKQLTVKYSVDGKAGEATFAEDTAIQLPTP